MYRKDYRIGIIIQARLGSKRLPGKVLKPIGDKTLLEYIMYRLQRLTTQAQIVIATSEEKKDDTLAAFCKERGYICFRGSEENVLERYYLCAKQYKFDHIVRLTADNPFVDVEELDRLIDCHIENSADYTKSFDALPCGVGAEIFTFAALEQDYMESSQPNHFEHVNEYIWENPQKFKIVDMHTAKEKSRPEIRLTVDTEEDYQRACYIAGCSSNEYISTEEAINLASRFKDNIL